MRKYRQLSFDERVKIGEMRASKSTITQMASSLGRPRSTIWREIRRNQAPPGEYWPDTAQRKTQMRRYRGCVLDHNEELKDFVVTKLSCHFWSPEQIAGTLKTRQKDLPEVSHETIYSWIYAPAQKREKLWKYLTRHKAKRGLRKSKGAGLSRIPHRVSIHDRPQTVSQKQEFGHWEGDLMSFQKGSQHMLVLRERFSMLTKSIVLPSKKAASTAENIIQLMRSVPPEARKTLTLDNGGEFAAHEIWAQDLGLPSYFCDAYASWQKGGVENTNGRLRRDLPRKTDLHAMNPEDFNETIENYNSTPRKSLNWFTPLEAFQKNLSRVALQT